MLLVESGTEVDVGKGPDKQVNKDGFSFKSKFKVKRFRIHQNQELSVTKHYANIDSETFSKTFMLTARPRPSS